MSRIFLRIYLTLLLSSLLLLAAAAASVHEISQWRYQNYLEQQLGGLIKLTRDGLARHQGQAQQDWLQALQQLLQPAQLTLSKAPASQQHAMTHAELNGYLTVQPQQVQISAAIHPEQWLQLSFKEFDTALLRTAMVLILNDLGRFPAAQRQQRFATLQDWFPQGLQRLPYQQVALSEAQQRQLQSGEIITALTSVNHTQFSILAPLGNSGMLLRLGPTELFEPYPTQLLLGTSGTVLLAMLLIGWRLNQALSKRVKALQSAITEAPAGQPLALDLTPQDELSAIAFSVNDMQQRIHGLMEQQRQLSNDIAHELRTPIARSLFRLHTLEEGLTAEHQRDVQGLRRDLHRLNDLTAEILHHAQLEHCQHWHCTRVHLNCLLQDIVNEMRHSSGVNIELKPSDSVFISAEATHIQRAVENLITNAMRYGNGQIAVSLEPHPHSVDLLVEDNGPGIPPELRQQVWLPFYRADGSRQQAHQPKGFGLGLAMVKRIVDAHQGSLTIETSALLGGCCIRMTLPLQANC